MLVELLTAQTYFLVPSLIMYEYIHFDKRGVLMVILANHTHITSYFTIGLSGVDLTKRPAVSFCPGLNAPGFLPNESSGSCSSFVPIETLFDSA